MIGADVPHTNVVAHDDNDVRLARRRLLSLCDGLLNTCSRGQCRCSSNCRAAEQEIAAAWILRNAARLRRVSFMLGGPPIGGPLPDIADHVVDAVAVGRE